MELTTIDTNNYAEMAKAMGIARGHLHKSKQASTLARLRINHSPVIEAEVNGKTVSWLKPVAHIVWKSLMGQLTMQSR